MFKIHILIYKNKEYLYITLLYGSIMEVVNNGYKKDC